MFDVHNHILPAVDDGARTLEVAVEMARMAVADGIVHMVASPHANDVYTYDRTEHETALEALRTRLQTESIPLELTLGCDFHLSFENVQDALANPTRYTIGKTPYLLVELSQFSVPPSVADSMLHLGSAGLRPILTHPERNPILQSEPERILHWIRQGVIMQVTASAITGSWGDKAQKVALWMLERRAVHLVASDAHDTKRRVPKLSGAHEVVAKIYGRELADMLVSGNPGAIVRGEPLPYFPEPAGGLGPSRN